MVNESGGGGAELERLGLLTGPFGRDASVFHVGIVVRDLASAVTTYGALLGLTFTEPMDLPFSSISTPEGEVAVKLRYAYSTRPLNIELIEASPGSIWDIEHPLQGRHLGTWSEDVAADSQRLVAAGMPKVAWVVGEDGRQVFSYHRTPLDFYIELVDTAARDFFPLWFGSVDPTLQVRG